MKLYEVVSTLTDLGFDINDGVVKYHKEGFGSIYKKGVFRVWSKEGLYCYPHEKLDEAYSKFKEVTKKNNSLQIKIFQNKWNFTDFFKIRENREILSNISNAVSHKSFDLTNNKKERMISSNSFIDATKTSLGAVIDFLNPFVNKKDEATPIKTRLDIVKINLNIFDLMIICLYSLNNCKNKINFELIMNDNYLSEFVLIFNNL